MKIINEKKFNEVFSFLSSYQGLLIESESEAIRLFPEIDSETIKAIISKYGQNRVRNNYHSIAKQSSFILVEYEKRATHDKAILEMARDLSFPPVAICRIILNEKYNKSDVKEMFRDPDLIPDPMLSANVFTCIFTDSQEGVIIDMLRYSIGEEYEVKLKKLAREAGLTFYDEGDLRRDGFDKTPDLLLAVQCLYKNTVINWIESKALFGDADTHLKYVKEQLSCYENRFGSGIVIYWFGFQEEILNARQNLIVLDDFPSSNQLTSFNNLYPSQS